MAWMMSRAALLEELLLDPAKEGIVVQDVVSQTNRVVLSQSPT